MHRTLYMREWDLIAVRRIPLGGTSWPNGKDQL